MIAIPLQLKFVCPQEEGSRYRVPKQLDALYRYPVTATLGETWRLSSYAERRSQLVAALLVYPPRSSAFEAVTVSDEKGKSFPMVSNIFVDARDHELGLQNAVIQGQCAFLRFSKCPSRCIGSALAPEQATFH